ncbi:MAG: hypothetical protein Q7J84_18980 [Sulfuricaulis sp.]|nr:hypothetical protein [Sulfuricaulis sp.]
MSWDSGFWWPYGGFPFFFASSVSLDATGEYAASVGRIRIAGKATNKTLDTTGSSSIRFNVAAAPVFDNAGSVYTVGFRGIDKTTGFPVRPDAAWATAGYARAVITTAAPTTPTLTTTSATGHVIVPTAGTITLSHGDEVCFVQEMTTKAGTDAVSPVGCAMTGTSFNYPGYVSNISGAPVGQALPPLAIEITFSDGTIGTLEGALPGQNSNLTWTDATNPDEQGLIFQVPWACTIDAIAFPMRLVDATSDLQFDLTSAPTTGPVSMISGPIALTAENMSLAANESFVFYTLASDVSLAANTDYCVSVKATGAGNIRWAQLNLGSAAARAFVGPAGTTIGGTTRNTGSGNYGAANTTLLNPCAVRISDISGFGGGMRLAGHGGLVA